MKIKNEYVQIKNGNKTYTKRNMILNKYLKDMLTNQLNPTIEYGTGINQCFIKLDTPIENINYNSQLYASDFDIVLYGNIQSNTVLANKEFKKMSTFSKDNITLKYNFTKDGAFLYNNNFYIRNEFDMFNGRKVATIGFGGHNKCYAVVDVNSMNIIINQGEEFVVSRVDTLQSDAICNDFEYPLHLVNFNAFYNVNSYGTEFSVAQLYSIGLGNKIGLMEIEEIIDFEEAEIGDYDITINFSELIKVGHYPSENLQLGFYPTMDNSRYLILKYRLYRLNITENKYALDEYYTMSYPIDLREYEGQTKNITFKLTIERK